MKPMKFLKKCSALLALALVLTAPGAAAAEVAPEGVAVWYVSQREAVRDLTVTAFYRVEDGALAPGLAQLPVDVTAEYAGSDLYGIGKTESRGRAFRLTLEQNVSWDDGTSVTASHVAEHLRSGLEAYPWIGGAESYLAGAEKPAQSVISLKDAGFDSVTAAKEAGYTRFYMDLAHFWGLEAGWEQIDSRSRFRDHAMPGGLDETFVSPAYLYRNYLEEGASLSFMHSRYVGVAETAEPMSMDDVGILEIGDHELVIITAEPMTAGTLAVRLAELTLEGNYGPYRMVTDDADEIILERNEYWQGDKTQYPAESIRCFLQ